MCHLGYVCSPPPPTRLLVHSVQSQVNGGGGTGPGWSRPSWASPAAPELLACVCVCLPGSAPACADISPLTSVSAAAELQDVLQSWRLMSG